MLIHFIFQLFKIAILASSYALLLLLLFRFLASIHLGTWVDRVSKNKKSFWRVNAGVIYVALFIWMFSYWGSHGLGDAARIPIAYGKEVEQINGVWAFISPEGHEQEKYTIASFAVREAYCAGKNKSDAFFIWNLKTNEVREVYSVEEYLNVAKELELPSVNRFVSFWEGYRAYWGGWRFWLLP